MEINYLELNKPFSEAYYRGSFVSHICMATTEPTHTHSPCGNGAVATEPCRGEEVGSAVEHQAWDHVVRIPDLAPLVLGLVPHECAYPAMGSMRPLNL